MLTKNEATPAIDANALQQQINGTIIFPHDEHFHEERQVWNGMIDKCPALIVQCRSTSNIVAAIQFARDNHLVVSVRGGGHNVARNAVCTGGLMIDLSKMKTGIKNSKCHRFSKIRMPYSTIKLR